MDELVDTVFISSVNLGRQCIQVYEISNGSCIKSFRGVCVANKTLCQIGKSDYIMCGIKDNSLLQAWALNQNDKLEMRLLAPGRVNVMAVNNSFNKICAMGIRESIHLIHVNTGLQYGIISRHYQDVTCLKFTACGNYLASGGEDGFVYLWSKFKLIESLHKVDKPQIQPHYILGQHSDKVTGICISEPGMRGILISTSMDHSAKIFDLVSGNLRHNIISSCGLTACAINIIGSQAFFAGENGKVWGMNLLPQKSNQNIEIVGTGTSCHESHINHIDITSTGDILVTGGADGEVKVWSVTVQLKKNTFSNPSLALQRTLITGKGMITNLCIWKMDTEVFNVSKLDSELNLVPFTKETKNVLESKVVYPVRKKPKKFDPEELINLAASLLKDNEQDFPSGRFENGERTMNDSSSECRENDPDDSIDDSLNRIRKLTESNEYLFKFCLKQILEADLERRENIKK